MRLRLTHLRRDFLFGLQAGAKNGFSDNDLASPFSALAITAQ